MSQPTGKQIVVWMQRGWLLQGGGTFRGCSDDKGQPKTLCTQQAVCDGPPAGCPIVAPCRA